MKKAHVWMLALGLLSAPIVAGDSFLPPINRLSLWPSEGVIEVHEAPTIDMENCLLDTGDCRATIHPRVLSPAGLFVPILLDQ